MVSSGMVSLVGLRLDGWMDRWLVGWLVRWLGHLFRGGWRAEGGGMGSGGLR